MVRQIEVEDSEDRLVIRRTAMGRVVAAVLRALLWFPLIFGGLTIFFMPDYVCRLAEEEPVAGLFWLSLAGLAGLVAFLAAVVRFLRRQTWTFDGKRRVVVAEMSTLGFAPSQGEVDLRDVEGLLVRCRSWPGSSQLVLRLDSGEEEFIIKGPGLSSAVRQATEAIENFMREQRYSLKVEWDHRDGTAVDPDNQ